jgi:hypothetical protein
MKIIKTNIPDFSEIEEQSKIDLAEKVLDGLIPLMNHTYQEKLKNIKHLKDLLIEKKKKVNSKKGELEILMKDYSRKKKINNLLGKIMELMGSGLLIGEFKKEMMVVLKAIEDLSEDKLDFYLAETFRVFNRRLQN